MKPKENSIPEAQKLGRGLRPKTQNQKQVRILDLQTALQEREAERKSELENLKTIDDVIQKDPLELLTLYRWLVYYCGRHVGEVKAFTEDEAHYQACHDYTIFTAGVPIGFMVHVECWGEV